MSKSAFIGFVVGASAGSAIAWYLTKEKYERLNREDIEALKEHYERKYKPNMEKDCDEPVVDPDATTTQIPEKPDIKAYAKMLGKCGYTDYTTPNRKTPAVEENEVIVKPNVLTNAPSDVYIIKPEEFGEIGYAEIALSYYADDILADENDDVVDSIEDVVGTEALEYFGKYENEEDKDVVFVRNDRLRCDYEICRDPRTYAEVALNMPRPMEV